MKSSNLKPIHWLAIFLFFLIPLVGVSIYFVIQQSNSDTIAENPPLSSPKSTPVMASPESAQFLATVTYSGGLCEVGQPCESVVTIYQNGLVERDDQVITQLSHEQLVQLVNEMNGTDYEAIMTQPFTGTCPIVFDGSELTYTFYLSGSTQVLPSCTYDLENVPLTTQVRQLIEVSEAAPSDSGEYVEEESVSP